MPRPRPDARARAEGAIVMATTVLIGGALVGHGVNQQRGRERERPLCSQCPPNETSRAHPLSLPGSLPDALALVALTAAAVGEESASLGGYEGA